MSRRRSPKIKDLATHPFAFVTVSALADYWLISPKQVYKQIDASQLSATRFGPKSVRIRTQDARQFEELARQPSLSSGNVARRPQSTPDRKVS